MKITVTKFKEPILSYKDSVGKFFLDCIYLIIDDI